MAGRAGEEGASLEEGATLIELLVTMVLIGLVASAVLGALFTLTVTSSAREHDVHDDLLVRTVLELVKAAPYEACADGQAYLAGFEPPEAWSADIEVAYWTGGSEPAFSDDRAQCAQDGDLGLQQITATVTRQLREGGSTATELAVLKRAGP